MIYLKFVFLNFNQSKKKQIFIIYKFILVFNNRLNEAEDRYRNRESRTDDLELISTLQQTIASYQEQLKRIHVKEKQNLKKKPNKLFL